MKTKLFVSLLLAAILAVGLAGHSFPAHAAGPQVPLPPAPFTWTGDGADALWSNPANWSGGASPAPGGGQDLYFPEGAKRLSNTNDLSFLTLAGIHFSGTGYVLSGSPVALAGTIEDSAVSGFNRLGMDIQLNQSAGVAVSDSEETLYLDGVVGGIFSLTKSGSGRLYFNKSYNFLGGLAINSGAVVLAAAPGTHYGTISVSSTGTLGLEKNAPPPAGITIYNPLELAGGARVASLAGVNGFWSVISIDGGSAIFSVSSGAELSLVETIWGSGGLIKEGPGRLTLDPIFGDNSYTGLTQVREGILNLVGISLYDVVVVPTDLVVGTSGDSRSAKVTVDSIASEHVMPYSVVTLHSGSSLELLRGDLFIKGLVNDASEGDTQVTIPAGSTLNMTSGPTNYAYYGTLAGAGTLSVKGTGTQKFMGGISTFSGQTIIGSGTLALDGAALPGPVNLSGGHLDLSNGALVGPLAATGGTLCLGCGGTANVTLQSLNMSAAASLAYTVTTGSPAQQATVTNGIALGGASLKLDTQDVLATGSAITLLKNLAGGVVVATFKNLPDGQEFYDGKSYYRINYQAGTENDVQLMVPWRMFVPVVMP